MPRFTPWHPGAELDQVDLDLAMRAVLRPSLKLAFPLPTEDDPADETFDALLNELAAQGKE